MEQETLITIATTTMATRMMTYGGIMIPVTAGRTEIPVIMELEEIPTTATLDLIIIPMMTGDLIPMAMIGIMDQVEMAGMFQVTAGIPTAQALPRLRPSLLQAQSS
jgi:hypothetical protein